MKKQPRKTWAPKGENRKPAARRDGPPEKPQSRDTSRPPRFTAREANPAGRADTRNEGPKRTFNPREDRPAGGPDARQGAATRRFTPRGEDPVGRSEVRNEPPKRRFDQRGDRPAGRPETRNDATPRKFTPQGEGPTERSDTRNALPNRTFNRRGDQPAREPRSRNDATPRKFALRTESPTERPEAQDSPPQRRFEARRNQRAEQPGSVNVTPTRKFTPRGGPARRPAVGDEAFARKPVRGARFSREVSIVYEDDVIVALNKPPGLPSVPITSSAAPSALTILGEALKPRRQRAMVVHRIDRFTSGILLFAKTNADRDALIKQFLKHTPVREYLAVVRGKLEEPEGELVHFLRRSGMFQKVSAEKDPEAARAELRYKVERPLRGATLVRVWLATGLQNQIRAQFAALGHPVVGDRKYRPEEAAETRISRAALHACRLEFIHPRTKQPVQLECPPPGDFQSLVTGLAPKRKGKG